MKAQNTVTIQDNRQYTAPDFVFSAFDLQEVITMSVGSTLPDEGDRDAVIVWQHLYN